MESVCDALVMPVHLANAQREVARIAQRLGLFDRILFRDPAVTEHPVVPGRLACQQRGPRRRAARRRRVGGGESRAFGR